MIAATHGKRAIDNLAQFKPAIQAHEMDAEVQNFEESILFFADAYRLHGPGSVAHTPAFSSLPLSPTSSGEATPELATSPASSLPSSRASSFAALGSRRPSFATRLNGMLAMSALPEASIYDARYSEGLILEADEDILSMELDSKKHGLQAWQIEATTVDRCVRILPGVKEMINSIPEGRYAVATSGAKTYGTSHRFKSDQRNDGLTVCLDSVRMHDARRHRTSQGDDHRR